MLKTLAIFMRVVIVTGRLAAPAARELAERFGAKVHVADAEVASLLTPERIARSLGRVEDADLVLVPGMVRGDVSEVAESAGVPVYKGTRHIADLEEVLRNIEELKLSTTEPADSLLEQQVKRACRELEMVEGEEMRERLLRRRGNMLIGEVAVGRDFPMRVIAEIEDADRLEDARLLERARYFRECGADIIDLGFAGASPVRVTEAVELLRGEGFTVAVDTMHPRNIAAAIDAGADLILSFDREMIEEFPGTETPSVIIPRSRGRVPEKAEVRVRLLEENIAIAVEQGFRRVVADPLLSPLNFGFVESIAAYRMFGSRNPDVVMLFGAGNVSELVDADSTGVNALLAGIASEVGASLLFTPEASNKTRGSVRELSTAAKMMFLAKRRSSPPKDLGLSLLMCKEKRLRREPVPEEVRRAEQVSARAASPRWDRKGYFRIYVDDRIYCAHFSGGRVDVVVSGNSARDIGDTLLRLKLIGEISHALYLGRELQKAEDALRSGRSYVQE